MWRNIMPGLEGYDVMAFDLLGCGDSAKPLDTPYSLKAHAGRLAAMVDALDIDRFHLVGHDLGGGISQIFAVDHGDRLIDLTLINPVAFDFWPVQPITAMRTPIIRQLLMASLDLGTFKLLVQRGVYDATRVTQELMELYARPLKTGEGRKAFLHFARSLDNRDLTEIADRLAGLTVPTLIIRGDGDVYLRAAATERLAAVIPGSRLVRIASAGHFIQEDEPEWLVDQLLEFFARDPAATAGSAATDR